MGELFDLIVVGGGLGGAALARSLAANGARVLVIEREERFRDRVRGEMMTPWGVAEAENLGIAELLRGRKLTRAGLGRCLSLPKIQHDSRICCSRDRTCRSMITPANDSSERIDNGSRGCAR